MANEKQEESKPPAWPMRNREESKPPAWPMSNREEQVRSYLLHSSLAGEQLSTAQPKPFCQFLFITFVFIMVRRRTSDGS
jgi:hypothetical protein